MDWFPCRAEVAPLRLNRYRGRLSAGGYRVEVSEQGFLTSLEIVTPANRLYQGREPGQVWTRRGAMLLFVAPLIFLALLWAFGVLDFGVRPLLPVFLILLMALAVHLLTRGLWRPRVPAGIRREIMPGRGWPHACT